VGLSTGPRTDGLQPVLVMVHRLKLIGSDMPGLQRTNRSGLVHIAVAGRIAAVELFRGSPRNSLRGLAGCSRHMCRRCRLLDHAGIRLGWEGRRNPVFVVDRILVHRSLVVVVAGIGWGRCRTVVERSPVVDHIVAVAGMTGRSLLDYCSQTLWAQDYCRDVKRYGCGVFCDEDV